MHAIFDLDGTITDSRPGIVNSVLRAFAELGYAEPNPSDIEIGPPILDTIRALMADRSAGEYAQAVEAYRRHYRETGVFESTVYAGMVDLLGVLRERAVPLYVATSKAKPFADQILNHFKLSSYFKVVQGCGLDGTLATKDEVLAEVLRQVKLPVASAVMIGDRRHDVLAAKKFGLVAIGVSWGYGSIAELQLAGADFVCRSPAELEKRFFELQATQKQPD